VELANDTAHLALSYIAAMQRQGYAMTVEEFEAYMAQPNRRPGLPGEPERRVVTTNIDRALRASAEQNLAPAIRAIQQSIAAGLAPREERIIPGTPGTPAESIADWLARLHWCRVDEARIRLTPLGEALLGHLEQESLEDEIPVGVVLDQGDELAAARVIQQLAEIGQCAVVDRFFSMDSLLPILYSTQVESVLMGSDAGSKLAGVETALRGLSVDRPFEVRKSDVFHDRFVIPPDGPVWALGTSFTGLARRLSIMVRIDDDRMSSAIRREFEDAWREAQVVAAKVPEPVPTDVEDVPGSSEAESGSADPAPES
jgi:hypothetical protein